jgi:hypothetical protein
MFELSIIVDDQVNTAFVKANKSLLDNNNIKSFTELQEVWGKKFNCKLTSNNTLIFDSERKLSMFVLTWG